MNCPYSLIMDKETERIFETGSAEETEKLGARVALAARRGDVIGLGGELGAGKTCMVRGAVRALGALESAPVLSPTFTIINRYEFELPVYHIDLYRLSALTFAIRSSVNSWSPTINSAALRALFSFLVTG